jgi:hypothetical protein
LTGTPPASYFANTSVLTDTHGLFGFNNIQSAGFNNTFSFSSITLTATVPSVDTGRGTLDYIPSADSGLRFVFTTSQTADPGSFVTIVPVPEPTSSTIIILGLSLAVGIIAQHRSNKSRYA